MKALDKPLFLSSSLLQAHGFLGIFSLRHGGVSPPPFTGLNLGPDTGDAASYIARNLKLLLDRAGVPAPHQTKQEHGTKMLLCAGPGRIHARAADILIGHGAGCAVGVRTADCLPVLLADPRTGTVAAIHAGWRGTVQGVATEAVRRMRALGAAATDLVACLGPCIGPCCFEVDAATASRLASCCPGADAYVRANLHVDLAAINIAQLVRAGVTAARIEHLEACTCCREEDYFSYRRDGGHSGRHLAIVAPARHDSSGSDRLLGYTP